MSKSERGHKGRELGNTELPSDIEEEVVARIAQGFNDVDRSVRQTRSRKQPAARLIVIVKGIDTLGIDLRIGGDDAVFHSSRGDTDLEDGAGCIGTHQRTVVKRKHRIGGQRGVVKRRQIVRRIRSGSKDRAVVGIHDDERTCVGILTALRLT